MVGGSAVREAVAVGGRGGVSYFGLWRMLYVHPGGLSCVSLKDDILKGAKGAPRYMAEHKVQTLFFALLLVFALVTVLIPLAIPSHSFDLGNEGKVGVVDNDAKINTIENPVVRFVYQFGDINCHQRDSRSFFVGGNQMPFCVRCTAIFVGLPLGMLAFFVVRREINPFFLILAFVPLGVDGVLQAVTSYESSNLLRVVTGVLAGLAAGYALAFIIKEFGVIFKSRKKS